MWPFFDQFQAARAANVIHSAFGFRRLVQKQETAPLMVMNVIPLCSQQACMTLFAIPRMSYNTGLAVCSSKNAANFAKSVAFPVPIQLNLKSYQIEI